ncbi:MAG: lipid A export permease/ATP-binding protein MsbA [Duodenibacillus sp.]|nr:lipid A export permease/ATP-binding protein MsbA [Duodenibacillus sp.]
MQWKLPSLSPSLRRLLTYLPPYKGYIASAIFFMITAGLGSSLIASLLGKLTDVGFYDQAAWIIVAAPVGLILVSILHGGSMFMSNYLLGKVSQSVMQTLRQQMFHQFLRWPAKSYLDNSAGKIGSKFVFEANRALSTATKASIVVVRDAVQVVCLTGLLFWQDWRLAIVSLVMAPFIGWLLRYISQKMRGVMASTQATLGSILVRVKEVHRGQRVVKLANMYPAENAKFEHTNECVRKMMVDMTKITALGAPLTQLICMCGVGFVLAFAMYQTQTGDLTMGDFVTFLAALLLLMPPLRNLAGVNASLTMMSVASKSIFHMLDTAVEDDRGVIEFEACKGHLTFDHVSLRYPKAKIDSVHDFNLEVNAGDCVALVGYSGSGKSSLVNMIPRFWNPTRGRILIDGVDTQEMTLASLRRHIAVVSQDVILFDDTIRNNILYGSENVSEEAVVRAIEASALTEVIESLPDGLETMVGEGGNRLSGGQKQRISIARALLKNAPILILDEATSALDSESEAKIKDALQELMRGRTSFVVAHRLSTIENATKIVAMADGKIQEQGTRAELLAHDGFYAKLCRLQSMQSEQEGAAQ